MRTTNRSLATEPTTQPGPTLELHKFLVLGEILLRAPAAGGPSAAGEQKTAAGGLSGAREQVSPVCGVQAAGGERWRVRPLCASKWYRAAAAQACRRARGGGAAGARRCTQVPGNGASHAVTAAANPSSIYHVVFLVSCSHTDPTHSHYTSPLYKETLTLSICTNMYLGQSSSESQLGPTHKNFHNI
jgi:hypothetical protein